MTRSRAVYAFTTFVTIDRVMLLAVIIVCIVAKVAIMLDGFVNKKGTTGFYCWQS